MPRGIGAPLVLLGVVLVLALIGGGYYVYSTHQPQKEVSTTQSAGTVVTPLASDAHSVAKADGWASRTPGFTALSVGQTIGDNAQHPTAGYTRDANGIYTVLANGRGPAIKSADLATFEVNTVKPIYARDKARVYVYGEAIPSADPRTFIAVCGVSQQLESFCAYGKDSTHVYAYTRIVEGADPATFTSLVDRGEKGEFPGKAWTDSAVDAHAYYMGYIPANQNVLGPVDGTRTSTLVDGSPIHFTDAAHITAVASSQHWAGYYEGLTIGSKDYYGGYYLVDGSSVYTVYSSCELGPTGAEQNCTTAELARVAKVGDRPAGL